ncbi:MAG: ABC transporter substrate binding protein [Candidatus Zixiibacteriota bacterium]
MYKTVFGFLTVLFLLAGSVLAEDIKQIRVGFFEGGSYLMHDLLRDAFRNELQSLVPEDYEIVFSARGYKTAGWNRDTCRVMAEDLAALTDLDLVVTFGPWVVEELLKAGFTKPIIALNRFDPQAEGLVDSTGYPIADNLTVLVRPHRFETDLVMFNRLKPIRKLGVLFFPSGNEKERLMEKFHAIGEQIGFEVVTAEGFNNVGTYAFFKAFEEIKKQNIDALYISPLWGFDLVKLNWFFQEVNKSRVPVFSGEGEFLVGRGALASNTIQNITTVARYAAQKARRIILGTLPADLPVTLAENTGLTLNGGLARQYNVRIPREGVLGVKIISAQPEDNETCYTFGETILQALAANPGYLACYEALEQAAAQASQAYAAYLPHLNAIGTYDKADDNTVYNSRDELKNDQLNLSLELRQKILSLPAIYDIKLAALNKEKNAISLNEATLDMEQAVVTAYLNYLKAVEILRVYEEKKQYIDYNLELTRVDQLMGDTGNIDIYRWYDEYYRVLRELNDCRNNVRVARILFNLLLSQPGETPFVLDTGLFSLDAFQREYANFQPLVYFQKQADEIEDKLVEQAFITNPRMNRYDIDIERQKKRLQKNFSRWFPTIGFRASLGFQDRLEDYPPGFEEKTNTASLGLTVTLPLFSGSDRIRERRVLNYGLSETEYLKDNARLDIIGRVRLGFSRLVNLLDNLPSAVESERQATAYVGLTLRLYSAGKTPLAGVADAIDNAVQSRLTTLDQRYGYYLAAASLMREVGWSLQNTSRSPGMELLIRLEECCSSNRGN